MLGSTILGFHTRYHCKNFIETVDRYLEARIEHEHSTIAFRDKETLVESYPISIEWPDAEVAAWPPVALPPASVRAARPAADVCLAVGVDRFDYTKGILERLNAVERLLEKRPSGSAASCSCRWPRRPAARWTNTAASRSASTGSRPAHQPALRPARLPAGAPAGQHHEHDAVNELFRAADICVVTSLHDGMNLVCKEFVAARDDCRAC
jgi:trehalose-6-phosphate synthase